MQESLDIKRYFNSTVWSLASRGGLLINMQNQIPERSKHISKDISVTIFSSAHFDEKNLKNLILHSNVFATSNAHAQYIVLMN